MEKKYVKRLIEKALERKLNSSGCVLVTGPKFCGKSTMCEQHSKSCMQLKTTNSIALAESDPMSALNGERPHLIDEWQKVPEIWNCIRDDLDKDYEFGKYILTGSTTPVNPEKIQHSGAGRISQLSLKPFTLFESGESTGEVSISHLFSDNTVKAIFPADNPARLADIAFMICRGGWPISLKAKKEYAIDVTMNYFNGLFTIENESDEFSAFLKNKDITLLKTILKSFARNISTQAKKTKMIADIIESGIRNKLDEDTFDAYKKVLEDLFIIYDMPAWNLNLRSSISIRKAPTHHFTDPSIAAAALGMIPADLMNDMETFGFFFEDLAVRDLTVYAESINGKLMHYRDSSGQEVDAIIETANGEYCAIEIKIYSEKNVASGIDSLKGASKNLRARFRQCLSGLKAVQKRQNTAVLRGFRAAFRL